MKEMINQEREFQGFSLNGFWMLFAHIILMPAIVVASVFFLPLVATVVISVLVGLFWIISMVGYMELEPNQARVLLFFGKYKGTFTKTGFYWVNPFFTKKKLSMRARNLDAEPIKVNDKSGNPIMVGLVLTWKLRDTYKAMFEIDSQTMATSAATGMTTVSSIMKAFENYVKIQSDAALRQVVTNYNYDNNEGDAEELTLRSGGEGINDILENTLNERLAMAGIEVVEARINYLAYAPEIAAVMLRRQQASAVISAREKIVEGAVSMVKMALDKLSEEEIVTLDDDKKAAMVSNLMVVLCADEQAQPVVNTGTLYN